MRLMLGLLAMQEEGSRLMELTSRFKRQLNVRLMMLQTYTDGCSVPWLPSASCRPGRSRAILPARGSLKSPGQRSGRRIPGMDGGHICHEQGTKIAERVCLKGSRWAGSSRLRS